MGWADHLRPPRGPQKAGGASMPWRRMSVAGLLRVKVIIKTLL